MKKMTSSLARAAVALAVSGALAGAHGAAQAQAVAPAAAASAVDPAKIPVADFFRRSEFRLPRLSPSGQYLAAIVPSARTKRLAVAIIDLKTMKGGRLVSEFSDADVAQVNWANEDWLVVSLEDRTQTAADQRGLRRFAVDREGKEEPRAIRIGRRDIEGAFSARHMARDGSQLFTIEGFLHDGSPDILVNHYVLDSRGDVDYVRAKRIGVDAFRETLLSEQSPPHVREWGFDRKGIPRLAFSVDHGTERLYSRAEGTKEWKLEAEYPYIDGVGTASVDGDGNAYLVMRIGKDDTTSLVRFPLAKGIAAAEPVVRLRGYDFKGSPRYDDAGHVVGVIYENDAWGALWFDPALKKIQDRIDALLPNTVNIIDCGRCTNPSAVLVTSYTDRQPAVFHYYDVRTDALSPVGGERPWIDRRAMATQDVVRVAARDGLSIPVLVTRPRGQKQPAPAVILVHGGPYVRGTEWGWRPDAQFLASRGYAVIEPEFRGSTGYGRKLYEAGWKQWGLKMQDDIADVTTWAVKQGIADGRRVAIAGASYGGYATLMGLVRYPELYRCGIEWAGVTDINFLYDAGWSDMSSEYEAYGMPVLIGDQKEYARQFEETSPVKQAARITRPLLMAHGTDDVRVTFENFTALEAAVKKNNRDVQTVVYQGEGHGWTLEVNNIDWWTRVQAFLDKNLKDAN